MNIIKNKYVKLFVIIFNIILLLVICTLYNVPKCHVTKILHYNKIKNKIKTGDIIFFQVNGIDFGFNLRF